MCLLLLFLLVPVDHADRRVEADPFPHARLLHAADDVVPEHFARRIGGNRLAEMFFERVVGEFEAFLRSVGPQVAVHGAVHRLAVFVEARAPRVLPQATPVVLLFIADDFRNLCALLLGGLECPQGRKPRWSRPDHRNVHG